MPTIRCEHCGNCHDDDLLNCPICLKTNTQRKPQKPLIEMKTKEEKEQWLKDAKDGKIMRII